MFGGVQIAIDNSYFIYLYFQLLNLSDNVIFNELCVIFMISAKYLFNKAKWYLIKRITNCLMTILRPYLLPIYLSYQLMLRNYMNAKISHLQERKKELCGMISTYSKLSSVNVGPLGISF